MHPVNLLSATEATGYIEGGRELLLEPDAIEVALAAVPKPRPIRLTDAEVNRIVDELIYKWGKK